MIKYSEDRKRRMHRRHARPYINALTTPRMADNAKALNVNVDGDITSLHNLFLNLQKKRVEISDVKMIPNREQDKRYNQKNPGYYVAITDKRTKKTFNIKVSPAEYNRVRCSGGGQRDVGPAEPKKQSD